MRRSHDLKHGQAALEELSVLPRQVEQLANGVEASAVGLRSSLTVVGTNGR